MTEGTLGTGVEEETRGEQGRERAIIRSVKAWFPSRRMTVALIGSNTFYSNSSPSLCRYLGESLWSHGVTLATNGTIGVSELVAWSYTFFGQQIALQSAFHFVQCKDKRIGDCVERSDIGLVIAAGKTEEEHMSIFSKICSVYILIEGGPRAACLVKRVLENGSVVIPVIRTGGAANGLFDTPSIPKPNLVPSRHWWALSDNSLDVRDTVRIIISILHRINQQNQ